jgi:hypothetical protein
MLRISAAKYVAPLAPLGVAQGNAEPHSKLSLEIILRLYMMARWVQPKFGALRARPRPARTP